MRKNNISNEAFIASLDDVRSHYGGWQLYNNEKPIRIELDTIFSENMSLLNELFDDIFSNTEKYIINPKHLEYGLPCCLLEYFCAKKHFIAQRKREISTENIIAWYNVKNDDDLYYDQTNKNMYSLRRAIYKQLASEYNGDMNLINELTDLCKSDKLSLYVCRVRNVCDIIDRKRIQEEEEIEYFKNFNKFIR